MVATGSANGVWGLGSDLYSFLRDTGMANLALWIRRSCVCCQTWPEQGFAPRDTRPFPQTGLQLGVHA
jgi:hypothetical protein